MTSKSASTPSKTGTYDVAVIRGKEVDVYVVEDGPAHMVLRVMATQQIIHLAKHVQ